MRLTEVIDRRHSINRPMKKKVVARSHLKTTFDTAAEYLEYRYGAEGYQFGNLNLNNLRLTSLKGLPCLISGDDGSFDGSFTASNNDLTVLEGFKTEVDGEVYLSDNDLTHLRNVHRCFPRIGKLAGSITLSKNPIRSHILGLLLIKNLVVVYYHSGDIADGFAEASDAFKILNQHLRSKVIGMKRVYECQQELLKAGLDEYAEL